MTIFQPEPWLRGPLAGIPSLLQPPAHVEAWHNAVDAALRQLAGWSA